MFCNHNETNDYFRKYCAETYNKWVPLFPNKLHAICQSGSSPSAISASTHILHTKVSARNTDTSISNWQFNSHPSTTSTVFYSIISAIILYELFINIHRRNWTCSIRYVKISRDHLWKLIVHFLFRRKFWVTVFIFDLKKYNKIFPLCLFGSYDINLLKNGSNWMHPWIKLHHSYKHYHVYTSSYRKKDIRPRWRHSVESF